MMKELKWYLEQKGYEGYQSVTELYNDGKTIKLELNYGDDEVIGLRILTRKGNHGNFRIAGTW